MRTNHLHFPGTKQTKPHMNVSYPPHHIVHRPTKPAAGEAVVDRKNPFALGAQGSRVSVSVCVMCVCYWSC